MPAAFAIAAYFSRSFFRNFANSSGELLIGSRLSAAKLLARVGHLHDLAHGGIEPDDDFFRRPARAV